MRRGDGTTTPGPGLRGRRIVLDPGHGGPDAGVAFAGVAEADVVWDLARRIEGRTAGAGMDVHLTRGEHACPDDAERVERADAARADLVLSLHVDADPAMHTEGLTTVHRAGSTVGEALAGYVHRELTSRTGMADRGTRADAGALLATRTPAVRIQLGFLSNLGDRRRLLDPVFRDVVAEGVLVAVTRFYRQGEDDQPTGTFTFSDVLAHEIGRNGASRAASPPSPRPRWITPPS